jgi:HSP20 family molecular chaperone IbpA
VKPTAIVGRSVPAQKDVNGAALGESLREHVAWCDLTDCLLSAYDGVARLAYEKFRARGKDSAGNELEDWVNAERELLGKMEVDVSESVDFVSALASVPGHRSGNILLGVEPNWLLIFARGDRDDDVSPARAAHSPRVSPDPPAIDLDSLTAMCMHAARETSPGPGENAGGAPAHLFYICELPAEVDPASCRAIVSNGLLGIRLTKVSETARNPGRCALAP